MDYNSLLGQQAIDAFFSDDANADAFAALVEDDPVSALGGTAATLIKGPMEAAKQAGVEVTPTMLSTAGNMISQKLGKGMLSLGMSPDQVKEVMPKAAQMYRQLVMGGGKNGSV